MTYTSTEIKKIYESALNKNITDLKVKKYKDILYEISDMGKFTVFSYSKLIYVLSNIKRERIKNLDKFRELYNLIYANNGELPKDFYVIAALLNSLYTDYDNIKKNEFKRITEDICFLFPSGNNNDAIELIKQINNPLGNLMAESSTFFDNRPGKYGGIMFSYMMNTMFSEMMVVFMQNIERYEYDYSLPSRVMKSLLENGKDAYGVIESYSKCKDISIFIKALFNVYKKENGIMFPKEKKEYENKKCILLS